VDDEYAGIWAIIILGILLLGGGIIYYEMFIHFHQAEGKVTSAIQDCGPLFCYKEVYFYGGSEIRWYKNSMGDIVNQDMDCKIITNGMQLQSANCTEV
jgi:hypothetical protein